MKLSWNYKPLPCPRWLAAILCTGIFVSGLGFLYAGGNEEREFFFNPDPAVELLAAQSVGSTTGLGISYTLYADGRLEIYEINYKSEKIGEALSYELTYEETLALIQEAVDSGLVEWNRVQIQENMRNSRSSAYTVIDGATFRLKIAIETYREAAEKDFRPVSVSIVFNSPTIVARRYPEIREIQGLATIANKLSAYRQKAQEVGNHDN